MEIKKFKNSGFTLIETLVAVSVLAFAFLGPLTLGYFSIRSASVAKNQLTAFFLAQDAMEFIRNWRDTNFLRREPMVSWMFGLTPCRASNCYVETTKDYPNGINTCGVCPKLKYNSTSRLYNYTTGSDTVFTRTIRFTDPPPSVYEEKVTITISWTERSYTRSFTLEENIFNWGGI